MAAAAIAILKTVTTAMEETKPSQILATTSVVTVITMVEMNAMMITILPQTTMVVQLNAWFNLVGTVLVVVTQQKIHVTKSVEMVIFTGTNKELLSAMMITPTTMMDVHPTV